MKKIILFDLDGTLTYDDKNASYVSKLPNDNVVEKLQKYKEAEEYFLFSLENVPNNTNTIFNLLSILIENGNLQKAEKIVNEFDLLVLNDESILKIVVNLYELLGNNTKKIEIFNKIIKLNPNNTELQYRKIKMEI